MKVLMFGWEFPPHISGGLGTACHGLTHSLGKENIDILFVVPKLFGGESADRTDFINASTVPIATGTGHLEEYFSTASVHSAVRQSLFSAIQKKGNIQYIEVPSALSPYRSPDFSEKSAGIEHWNYSIEETTSYPPRTEKKAVSKVKGRSKTNRTNDTLPDRAAYKFSGSYGSNLMEEVRRYAQVGASIASQFDFDVIHAHDWMTYLAGIAAKKISGKPLVVHVHATEFDRSGDLVDPQVHAIEHQGMTEADSVVTVSNWTKNVVMSRYHLSESKVCVVHNGIVPRTNPPQMEPAPPIGSHIVTFLGRITHQKGPLFFVEAARKVLDQIPDAHFVVAGSGDLMPVMLERIAQLRMSSHFHFTGFLKGKDIDRIWAMSNVYVMPSVSEPFGIAPLEAIQAGVPVIISKQSGVAEVMPHAIKVDFWNSNEVAAAICSVLRYKSLSNTLTRNSAEEIADISWNTAAKKLTNLYYELTGKPPRTRKKSGAVLSGAST
jgi:glycosyltransferase involved in cell wall biosynthesis